MSNSTATSKDRAQLGLFEQTEAHVPDAQDWRVRVSPRARNLKIQVYPHGGVEIVAPKRVRPAEIEAFVAEHRNWIIKTQSQFYKLRPPEPPLPEYIALPAIGENIRLHYCQADKSRISERNGLLTLAAPAINPEQCWPLLQKWLRQKGRSQLVEIAHRVAEASGLQPARVHIRLQRSRWGSCSTSGTVSLNAAILLRPPEEMHYVIIHELCHLRHMNHSKRFWKLVEHYVPDYRAMERSLNAAWQTSPRWLIG